MVAYSRPVAGEDVMWAQGSGSGVRSWAYHGVGKVHRRRMDDFWKTRCGVRVPSASKLIPPGAQDERCKRCEGAKTQ